MAYTVKLNRQNITFLVNEDESILEAALKQGINLPYGCRNGECGSCIAEITEGSFFYNGSNPEYLQQEGFNKSKALLCQARASSNIAIDSKILESDAEITLKQFPCRVKSAEKLND